ncbi:DNA repair protein RecN [Methylacidimicrobium cyclopophantes]|uniref:DNA repair protein RecN n=1 Tax=Methylacidimicrobium cyclopophantes TaxID=1041766 RepID=A0A5E6MI77_9BACT|nr:DNA repair protein RecN [Methylacidimicrobium cyclopophantes]VVM08038.1 DNA repair protein RecN [Methylacidimicrobium cyclopophantes]
MLRSLRVEHLPLIGSLEWTLEPGFTVITGETGAGKSLLLGALGLLLGNKADRSLHLDGEKTCSVEGEFVLNDHAAEALDPLLDSSGIDRCEEGRLLVKRSISPSGGSRQFVNGCSTTRTILRQVGDLLLDLHGPHEHQSLLQRSAQLALLDAFGGLHDLVAGVEEAFEKLETARSGERIFSDPERERQRLRLTSMIAEIDQASIRCEEEEQIARELQRAQHGWKLIELVGELSELLFAEGGALDRVSRARRLLGGWSSLDAPGATKAGELLEAAAVDLREMEALLLDYRERLEVDPDRLNALEQRRSLLEGLKRKYGPTLSDVLATLRNAERELAEEEAERLRHRALAEKRPEIQGRFEEAVRKLGEERRRVGELLARKVSGELAALGFPRADFRVEWLLRPQPGRRGGEEAEFLFTANPGRPPLPLRETASSGEMARVMLAIKTVLAAVDRIPILIFDEVDANVAGETAWKVGARLRTLGLQHQVICVTHLAPVAAQGDSHFSVRKSAFDNTVTLSLEHLDSHQRAEELARMLGGKSDESLALAARMLASAPHPDRASRDGSDR